MPGTLNSPHRRIPAINRAGLSVARGPSQSSESDTQSGMKGAILIADLFTAWPEEAPVSAGIDWASPFRGTGPVGLFSDPALSKGAGPSLDRNAVGAELAEYGPHRGPR